MTTDKNNAAPDPQPAELAEQQGASLPPFPRTYYDAFGDGSELLYTGKQMQEYARAALAATGKQQVGVFPWENLPAYLIDKCEGDTISEEGIQRAVADMARDARYCQQQVGEVQGDALIDTALGYLSTALDDLDSSPDRRPGIMVTEAMQALREAIAARQPGAQLPVGQVRTRVDGVFIAELFPGVADRVSNMAPLYVAAPAQGIDLGQLWEPIKDAVHTALSAHVPGMRQNRRELVAVYVARQLHDGQRDSARGMTL